MTAVECYAASYWYRVNLTVTDPTGASDFYQKDIFPACAGNGQSISFSAIPDRNSDGRPIYPHGHGNKQPAVTFYLNGWPKPVFWEIP
ncbi:MAG: hypothetical protein R2788_26845 [Saprospiraceae bacterium]